MPRDLPPARTLDRLARTARAAVAEIGAFAARRFRPTPGAVRRERKGVGDFVTAVDRAAEARLRQLLQRAEPSAGFLGEETGSDRPGAELLWVVDPIDGTSNFLQGLSPWSVSVGLLAAGRPVVAAAWIAPEATVYSAVLGRGARRGRRRLVTPPAQLDDGTVVGVQWLRERFRPGLLRVLGTSGARVRVFGSTVVQLCDVAAGRLHANVQVQGRLWDIAAAALIASEAGAVFTDWRGRDVFPIADPTADRHYPSLAAPPPLHAELVDRLARA